MATKLRYPTDHEPSIEVRAAYGRFDDFATSTPGTDSLRPHHGAWSAVCFVVRPGFRRHGLMHVLLAGAVEHAAAHGAEVVQGYPVQTLGRRVDVTSGYVGSVELFEAAGFVRAAETTSHSGGRSRVVMRRRLR